MSALKTELAPLTYFKGKRELTHTLRDESIYKYIMFPHTVFPLLSAPSFYLILKLWSMTIIGGQRFKEGGADLKVTSARKLFFAIN